MKKNDRGLEIIKVENGFSIKDNEGKITVVEEKDGDELAAAEALLWAILEFFNLNGTKHDRERIAVIRKIGERYTLKKGEKILREQHSKLANKDLP